MEIIAVLFTLASVYLTAKSSIWNWPVGIVGIAAYFVIFVTEALPLQATLQLVFIVQSIMGWLYWKKTKEIDFGDNGYRDLSLHVSIVICLTAIACTILKVTNILEIFTVSLSLLANMYIVRRKILGWVLWMATDIFMIIMFMEQKLYYSAALYLFLFIFALNGLIQWTKNLKTV